MLYLCIVLLFYCNAIIVVGVDVRMSAEDVPRCRGYWSVFEMWLLKRIDMRRNDDFKYTDLLDG